MKLNFKYNTLHLRGKKPRRLFRSIEILFDWTYFRKIKIEIKKKFKLKFSFYDSKLNAELLPGWGRKKNKLTFTKKIEFLNIDIEYKKIRIVKKHEYRKILKKQGLLK